MLRIYFIVAMLRKQNGIRSGSFMVVKEASCTVRRHRTILRADQLITNTSSPRRSSTMKLNSAAVAVLQRRTLGEEQRPYCISIKFGKSKR